MTTSATSSRTARKGNPAARVWLFDFDNTLAALEPEVDWAGSRRVLESYLRDAGIPAGIFAEIPKGNLPLYAALHARLLRAGGDQACGFATSLIATGIDGAALMRRASEIIETHELAGVERAAPLPGAGALLDALAARPGTAIAIVTSNSSRLVWRRLERHRLTVRVRAVVGRDSMLALKPSPAMVERALALCACVAGDAAFVGDSTADAEAAAAAGVGFYGMAAGPDACARLTVAGVHEIFASPAALAEHLKQLR